MMKHIVPDYYNKFSCIGDKCKHNCCIGWEISIDSVTYDMYKEIKGEFGEKLNFGIDHQSSCFKLDEKERCVFLNNRGLCSIICNLGEDYLCDICNDHPRFRNFFQDREEIGLGLCCEEACRIILSAKRTEFIESDDGTASNHSLQDDEFFTWRNKQIEEVQNLDVPFYRTKELPGKNIQETLLFYRSLERFSEEWDSVLDKATHGDGTYSLNENIARQLAVYFLYRYGNRKLAEHAVGFIEMLCDSSFREPSFENICNICRMYSCEVEYSDINIELVKKFFEV